MNGALSRETSVKSGFRKPMWMSAGVHVGSDKVQRPAFRNLGQLKASTREGAGRCKNVS